MTKSLTRAYLSMAIAASIYLGACIGLIVSPPMQTKTIFKTDPRCDSALAREHFDTQHPELNQALENKR